MSKVQLVIDIGSKFTTISQLGKGFVLKDASLTYISNKNNKIELIDVGRSVASYINSQDPDCKAVYPIREGAIYHERAAILMYRAFLKRVLDKTLIKPRINVIACVSCGLTNTEKHDIEKVLLAAGVNEVIILESPLAMYASLENMDSAKCLIDIGASKTEVSVVNREGIVSGCSLNIGGNTFNMAIMNYVLDTKRRKLTLEKAEKIKKQLLNLSEEESFVVNENLEELGTGHISKTQITSSEIKRAILPYLDKLVDAILTVLNQIPDKITNEVAQNGITLCGGSSRINGLCNFLKDAIGVNVQRVDDPENATSIGGLYYLSHRDELSTILNIVNLK